MVSRKRPRSTETARPLLYYDEIRQAIVQSQNAANGAIPPGVTYQSSSSILHINPQELLGTSEGYSFRLMHLPTLFGFSRRNGDGERSVLSPLFTTAKSALLAVEHFNNRDESVVPNLRELLTDSEGKECDLRMTLDFYDTERNALIASKRLSQDIFSRDFPYEATAIAGAVRSAVSIPMAILNTVRNLPQISYASTSSTLDERDTYRFFGRVVPSSDGDARALMQYYAELGVTHVGILYVQDDYGSTYRLSLETAAAERDIQIGSAYIKVNQEDRHASGGIADAIYKLKSLGYRYFVGIIFPQHFRLLTEVASEAGIMGPGYVWMIGDGVTSGTVTNLRLPRDSPKVQAVHGVGFISTGSATKGGYFDRFFKSLRESDKTKDFRHLYAAKSPLLQDFIQFDLNHTVTESSSFPPLAFDSVMALGIAGCKAPAHFFTGKQLFDEFLNVSFGGASGPVSIDGNTGGRSYGTMAYKIVNVVATNVDSDGMLGFEAKVAAEYYTAEGSDSASWTQMEGVQYNYSGMTLDPPSSLPPVEASRDLVETSAFAIISAAACLVMLSAVVFGAWTWHYRSSHVVRASQPEFLVVVCVGVFLMAASALTLGFENPPFPFWLADASCMINMWFFCTGFGLAFSALFAKTWRINMILSRKNQFRRVAIGPKDVLLPGTCIFLGNVAVLLVWQLRSPLHYLIVEEDSSLDEYGRPNKMSSTCQSSGNNDGYYYLALLVINGFAIIAANVQAFRARGITTEFSESKYIGLAMGVILQAIIIVTPVIFQSPGVTANYLIRGIVIMVTCSSILYLIFIPKILFWRTWKPQTYRPSELFRGRSSPGNRLSFYTKRDGLVIPANSANKPGDSGFDDVAVENPENINQHSSLELASADTSSSQPFGSGMAKPFRLSSLDSHSASLELSAAASGGGEIGCRQRVQSSRRQSHTDFPEEAHREEVDDDDDSSRVGIQVIAFRKSLDQNQLGREAGDSTCGLRVISTHSQHSIDFAVNSDAFDLEGNSFAEDEISALACPSLPRRHSVSSHASMSLGRPASQRSSSLELANSSCGSLLSGPKKRTSLNEDNSPVEQGHKDEIDDKM